MAPAGGRRWRHDSSENDQLPVVLVVGELRLVDRMQGLVPVDRLDRVRILDRFDRLVLLGVLDRVGRFPGLGALGPVTILRDVLQGGQRDTCLSARRGSVRPGVGGVGVDLVTADGLGYLVGLGVAGLGQRAEHSHHEMRGVDLEEAA